MPQIEQKWLRHRVLRGDRHALREDAEFVLAADPYRGGGADDEVEGEGTGADSVVGAAGVDKGCDEGRAADGPERGRGR